jgi:hypothetical protein
MNCEHVTAGPHLMSEFLRFAYLSEFLGLRMSKEVHVALQSPFLLIVSLLFYSRPGDRATQHAIGSVRASKKTVVHLAIRGLAKTS